MRQISKEYKLNIRVPWDVNEALSRADAFLARSEQLWQHHIHGKPKRPTRAAIVAAIILALDERGQAEKEATLARGMSLLNGLIDEVPIAPAVHDHAVAAGDSIGAMPKRRRTS